MAKKKAAKKAEQKPRQRGRGEGCITQRKDGRWSAVLSLGTDANGKRRRKTVYGKTRKEVADELTRAQNQKLDGTLAPESKLTVKEFLDRWLRDAVSISTKISTQANYAQVIKVHLTPRIGGLKLSKLTPAAVQAVYSDMARKGKSVRMQELTHSILRRALVVGMKWGLLTRNVCDAVERPKPQRAEMKTLTPAEAAKFLQASREDRMYALYVLAIVGGLRQGELLALEWQDIDLAAATLAVRRTLVYVNREFSTGDPKTEKSRRVVHLPQIAVRALRAHRAQSLREGLAGNPRVFTTPEGTEIRREWLLRRSLRPLLKAAKVPEIRFHDLRHSCATLLLSEGVHPKIVQERLGHSSIQMTMDVYSHALPSMQEDSSAKLDRLFLEDVG